MPDTKIEKTINGWIDKDDPATFHRVRRLARDARRAKRAASGTMVRATRKTRHTIVGLKDSLTSLPLGQQTLSSLQQRLYERLTKHQGVADDDAAQVIVNNGYNKAASYGHMRAAGATHAEAEIVVGLDSPDISLAYGKGREKGLDHTTALSDALRDA